MFGTAREYDTDGSVRVRLTLGAPGVSPPLFARWLGLRFVAWIERGGEPDEPIEELEQLLARPRMGVASSRIGRALDERPDWFAALRAACQEASERRCSLLAVSGTTTGPFIVEAARRTGLPCVLVDAADDRQSFETWLSEVVGAASSSSPPPPHTDRRHSSQPLTSAVAQVRLWLRLRLKLSPPIVTVDQWQRALVLLERAGLELSGPELSALEPSGRELSGLNREANGEANGGIKLSSASESFAEIPARDRALCVLADELRLLDVRRQGNWAKLAAARRAEPGFPAESMREVDGGARAVRRSRKRPALNPPTCESSASIAGAPIINLTALDGLALLTHCTRRQDGPWPGQAWDEYFDELWDDSPAKDRSASGALANILRAGRIAASGAAIRGATPMVCFTSASPRELAGLRRFRRHRHRWDFEPYGLAVSRDWLSGRGARPVVYGDESVWAALSDDERPYFQPTVGRGAIDWTVENEWRLVGDLSLDEIPHDAAFVLANTRADAERLAPLSPWPVAVLS